MANVDVLGKYNVPSKVHTSLDSKLAHLLQLGLKGPLNNYNLGGRQIRCVNP